MDEIAENTVTPSYAGIFLGSPAPTRRELLATIADLRAVLAPLLDNPTFDGHDEDLGAYIGCRFCSMKLYWSQPLSEEPHDPDCAVLRRDELLGR